MAVCSVFFFKTWNTILMLVRSTSSFEPNVEFVYPLGRRLRFENDYVLRHYHKYVNRFMPNDPYMGRTAPLTSKCCILYIYSTNIGTECFKHALYSPFFSLQNAVCFIMLTCLVPVLFTFYIQDVLKLKKIIPVPKG